MEKLYETLDRGSYVQYIGGAEYSKKRFNAFSSSLVSNKDRSMPSKDEIFARDYLEEESTGYQDNWIIGVYEKRTEQKGLSGNR